MTIDTNSIDTNIQFASNQRLDQQEDHVVHTSPTGLIHDSGLSRSKLYSGHKKTGGGHPKVLVRPNKTLTEIQTSTLFNTIHCSSETSNPAITVNPPHLCESRRTTIGTRRSITTSDNHIMIRKANRFVEDLINNKVGPKLIRVIEKKNLSPAQMILLNLGNSTLSNDDEIAIMKMFVATILALDTAKNFASSSIGVKSIDDPLPPHSYSKENLQSLSSFIWDCVNNRSPSVTSFYHQCLPEYAKNCISIENIQSVLTKLRGKEQANRSRNLGPSSPKEITEQFFTYAVNGKRLTLAKHHQNTKKRCAILIRIFSNYKFHKANDDNIKARSL